MVEQRLFPPLRGVSEALAFGEHDPGYARDALNVRAIDPANGRARLTKRPGLSKRSTAALNGSAKVSALQQVTFNNLLVDFANLGVGNTTQEANDNPTALVGGGFRIVSSPRGDLYATTLTSGNGGKVIYRYNADLSLISTITIHKIGSSAYIDPVFVDEFDNVWVGMSGVGTGGRRIIRYELAPDNEHRFVWALRDNGAAPHDTWEVTGLTVKNGRLYTMEQSQSNNDLRVRVFENIYDAVSPTEAVTTISVATAGGSTLTAGGVAVNDQGDIFVSWMDQTTPNNYTRKYNPLGTTVWTLDSVTLSRGGLGSNLAVRGNYVATTGPNGGGGTQWVSLYTDNGSTATHQWSQSSSSAALTRKNPIEIDEFFSVHVVFPMSVHVGGIDEVQSFNTAGTQVSSIANTTSTPVTGLALPPTNPDYTSSAAPPVVPEFLFIATNGEDYQKWRLVSSSPSSGSTRSSVVLAASGDDLVTLPSTSPITTPVAAAAPTGGAGSLDSSALYVQMATGFSKGYAVDGITNLVYDPVEDTVEEWLSTTSGTIPRRCSLVEFWNGRACLAGDPDNRHLLHMSASGDPNDWDLYPPTPTSTMAVAITTMPQIGGVADIINTMIPYSNDLLILGGDRTISVVRGDPAAGGSVDQITTSMGMSFGRPWCIGPQGEVYFFASQGGVYALNPYSGDVMPLSRNKLDRQLRDVDLGTHYVQMVYDHKNHGVMVLVFPFGSGGTLVTHYFIDVRNGGFWPEQYGTASSSIQPTAVCLFDADDPDDRTILLGGEDGFVRFVDDTAEVDEGASANVGIDGYVTMGPFAAEDGVHEMRMRELWASMGDKGDVAWEVYGSERADLDLDVPMASGVFQSGRNARAGVRVRASHLWVRLRNSDTTGGFAVESLTAGLYLGPRVRRASF